MLSLTWPIQAMAQTEGHVYRETSSPEVFLVAGGKRIWVPTPDALFGLGYKWSNVEVVADGFLSGLPRFNIPSGSPTPGSIWYPPTSTPDGKVNHFPLAADPNAVTLKSRGREVRLTALQGWLRRAGETAEPCGDGLDFHYFFELDTEWAEQQGIDLQSILRVGNIATGVHGPGSQPRAAFAIPIIEAELDAAGRMDRNPPGDGKPADWNFARECDGETRIFPFDPFRPDGEPPLPGPEGSLDKRGPYVRIYGSLITDNPHDIETKPSQWLSKWLGIHNDQDAGGAVSDWSPKVDSSDPRHYARWTEIHPPDKIEVLPDKEPKYNVMGVAIAARTSALPGDSARAQSCEEVSFDMTPETPKPSGSHVAWQELRGPETFFPWQEDGDNGSWITVERDIVHVRAKVCGGALFTSPGRFKALYRVFWVPGEAQHDPSPAAIICQDDCANDRDVCMAAEARPGGSAQVCTRLFNGCVSHCPP